MLMRVWTAAVALVLAGCFASLSGCAGSPTSGSVVGQNFEPDFRVLAFSGTGWFRHPEMPETNGWLVRLGVEHGFDVDVTETPGDITPERLAGYDVFFLQNANNLGEVFDEEQRQALEAFYTSGGAFAGIHAMAVQHDTWPWLRDVIGCDFDSDSDYQPARVVIDPEARHHPAVAGHYPEFEYQADWHSHTKSVTGLEGVTVLMRLDEDSYEPVRPAMVERGGRPMGDDHPAAWIREYNGGRLFYTSIGHDLRALDTEFGRQHVAEGIRWAAEGVMIGGSVPSERRGSHQPIILKARLAGEGAAARRAPSQDTGC